MAYISKSRIDNLIRSSQASIEKSGFRSIRMDVLIHSMGAKKRSAQMLQTITDEFAFRNLYFFPELSMSAPFLSTFRIINFKEERFGDLFSSERELEDFIVKKRLLQKLGVKYINRQYSPGFSPTKIDLYGSDVGTGKKVVVELKKDSIHGYHLQLMEYTNLIQQQESSRAVRKILVTGVLDRKTAHSIHAMNRLERETFEWYVYRYDKSKQTLDFIEIDIYEIEKRLNNFKVARKRKGEPREIQAGIYKEFHGKKVEVLGLALEPESEQEVVIYRKPDRKSNAMLLMTIQEFNEEVRNYDTWVRRFERV